MGRATKPIGKPLPIGSQSTTNAEPLHPPMPLDDVGMNEWKRILATPVGKSFGESDLMTLATYCDYVSQWTMARAVVAKEGITVITAKGNVVQNPALGIVNRAKANIIAISKLLGLTPLSKTKVPRIESVGKISKYIGDIEASVDRRHGG